MSKKHKKVKKQKQKPKNKKKPVVASRSSVKSGGAPKSHGPVMEIATWAQFKKYVLNAKTPVLVDFWAPWCGPCQAMAPVFEAVANENVGTVLFAKVNTEAAPEISDKMNIRSLPTLLAFYEGDVKDVQIGMSSAMVLRKLVGRLKKLAPVVEVEDFEIVPSSKEATEEAPEPVETSDASEEAEAASPTLGSRIKSFFGMGA